jgi:hypothetical protein
MQPLIQIRGTSEDSVTMDMRDVRDLAHVRRILIQALLSVEGEGVTQYPVPRVKLELLRSYLVSVGMVDKGKARRLLCMALLQLEDEDDAQRFVMPHPCLPVISP